MATLEQHCLMCARLPVKIESETLEEKVPFAIGRFLATARAFVVVHKCQYCKFSWTDSLSEDVRARAVRGAKEDLKQEILTQVVPGPDHPLDEEAEHLP